MEESRKNIKLFESQLMITVSLIEKKYQITWDGFSVLLVASEQTPVFSRYLSVKIHYQLNDCTMKRYCMYLQQCPDRSTHRQQDVCETLWRNGTKTPNGLQETMEISWGPDTVFAV